MSELSDKFLFVAVFLTALVGILWLFTWPPRAYYKLSGKRPAWAKDRHVFFALNAIISTGIVMVLYSALFVAESLTSRIDGTKVVIEVDQSQTGFPEEINQGNSLANTQGGIGSLIDRDTTTTENTRDGFTVIERRLIKRYPPQNSFARFLGPITSKEDILITPTRKVVVVKNLGWLTYTTLKL